MRIMLGFLNHWITWRSLCHYNRNLKLIFWTTISWLLWSLWKLRMWWRINGQCLWIRYGSRNWIRISLPICRRWPNMRLQRRQCHLQEHWIHQCHTIGQWCLTSCRCSTTNLNCYWCWRHYVLQFRYLRRRKLRNLIRPRSPYCRIWSW